MILIINLSTKFSTLHVKAFGGENDLLFPQKDDDVWGKTSCYFIRSFGMFYFEAGIRLKFPVFASGISFK